MGKSGCEEEDDDDEDAIAFLPLHLLAKILALLPIPSLAQLRLVCRSWNSLLSPASFSSRDLQPECWFVMAAAAASSSAPQFIAFSPSFGPWTGFRLPLDACSTPLISSVLGDLCPFRIAFSQSIVPSVVNMLVSSAGGLMCAVIKDGLPPRIGFDVSNCGAKHSDEADPPMAEVDYDVVVFNFLTDTVRRLPRPFRLSQRLVSSCSISMSVDPATNSYRVILSDPKYRDLEIYDSKRHRWSKGLGIRSAGATYNNIGMHDLLGGDLIRYHKDELAAYNAGSNEWWKVEAPLPRCPPLELLRGTVIKCRGRLLLVACLMEHAVAMKGFGVWELQSAGGGVFSWAEVARTPAETLEAFRRTHFESPSFYDCRFMGHDDLLCMTGADYMIGSQSGAQYWPPLVYDVPRDVWHHLPPYKQANDFLCVFSFQPTFDAAV